MTAQGTHQAADEARDHHQEPGRVAEIGVRRGTRDGVGEQQERAEQHAAHERLVYERLKAARARPLNFRPIEAYLAEQKRREV